MLRTLIISAVLFVGGLHVYSKTHAAPAQPTAATIQQWVSADATADLSTCKHRLAAITPDANYPHIYRVYSAKSHKLLYRSNDYDQAWAWVERANLEQLQ